MRFAIFLCVALVSVRAVADDDTTAVSVGRVIYSQTCIACHGTNGKGAIPGVADLTKGDGALSKPDEALLNSITEGFQSPGSALAMPPRGGNPTLTEEDVEAVLAYLRAEFGRTNTPHRRRTGSRTKESG